MYFYARFTYDLRGNRLTRSGKQRRGTEGADLLLPIHTAYTYDVMDRLVREDRPEGGEEYTYDGNGNRLTRTGCHYGLVKEKGKVGFAGAVVDATENYWYNEGNQLIQGRRGKETTSYTYDGNGSLIRKGEARIIMMH